MRLVHSPLQPILPPHPLVSAKLSSPGLDLVMLVQVASNPQRSPGLCLLSADIKGESYHASVPSFSSLVFSDLPPILSQKIMNPSATGEDNYMGLLTLLD